MRLKDFGKDDEPQDNKSGQQTIPTKEELDEAIDALHKAYLLADKLLRNIPDTK